MSPFDLTEFEAQIDELLIAYQRLQTEYNTLKAAHDTATKRNHEIRERLDNLVKRLRTLENEAESS